MKTFINHDITIKYNPQTSRQSPRPINYYEYCSHYNKNLPEINHILRKPSIQPSYAISQPSDPYEQEANRIADQIMRLPEPKETEEDPVPRNLMDGGEIHRQTELPENDEGEVIQAKSVGQTSTPIHSGLAADLQSLKGQGYPLLEETRAFFEPRFGADFSQVRVHTDGKANETAKGVNAKAFTHGIDIIFDSGQYAPETDEGKHLMGHELVHVVQQGSQGQQKHLQRFVSCQGPKQCPRRTPGEVQRSQNKPHQVEIYDKDTFGILISNFAIGEPQVKIDLSGNPIWANLLKTMGKIGKEQWEVLGYTDCQGSESLNRELRIERAKTVAALLPSQAKARVSQINAAVLNECIESNVSEAGRNHNRSVLIRRKPGLTGPADPVWKKEPIGPVRPEGAPDFFCIPYYLTGSKSIFERARENMGRQQAAFARKFLKESWLTIAEGFGKEVYDLWQNYLNRKKGADVKTPRIFKDQKTSLVVWAFRLDPATVKEKELFVEDIKVAAARTPEANIPFNGARYLSPEINLGILLPEILLHRDIRYKDPDKRIPGNIAGGLTNEPGKADSDAGPDLRIFSGAIKIERIRQSPGAPEIKKLHIEKLQLKVIDAIDFCPGAWGGLKAQQFTIPMSRLEATPTEPTYDLPFHVIVELVTPDHPEIYSL